MIDSTVALFLRRLVFNDVLLAANLRNIARYSIAEDSKAIKGLADLSDEENQDAFANPHAGARC